MLWRFSFASASTLDALLSRETPPSVEELLDEQELLSEVKAQNNKLVSYLSKEDSIKSLLQWVISGLDELDQQSAENFHALSHPPVSILPGRGSPPLEPIGLGQGFEETGHRSKYPSLSTEVLTSELWTITETVMANKDSLLRPFWEAVLPPLEPSSEETAPPAQNGNDPSGDERSEEEEERDRKREMIRGMWVRVNGAFMTKRTTEMIRFIQTIPNIVERMMARIESPAIQDMVVRIVSAEEAGVPGVVDWLAEEGLVARLLALLSPHHPTSTHSIAADLLKSIITLCAPSPFNPLGGNAEQQAGGQGTRDNRLIRELVSEKSIATMIGFMLDPLELTDENKGGDPFMVYPLPSISSASSSMAHVCNILVELIRRNNSDFSEPHLFHTLRNRIFTAKQNIQDSGAAPVNDDEMRSMLEGAMLDNSPKMGIVHLGNLLTVISERFEGLHQFLIRPRSIERSASAANAKPLTFERFRIVELYAELLHSSNMSIINRKPGTGPVYSAEGILSGGLDGLEKLGNAIEGENEAQVTQARELPVSSGSTDCSLTESDVSEETPETVEAPTSPEPSDDESELAPGDRLKQVYIQHKVLQTVVDLFFEHPNNDFLHHIVYDLLQQILNGRLGPGFNRNLVVVLIRDANLIERILDAQRLNDRMIQQPRTPRLAYMGHTVLIAEELVKFFERCPEDLAVIIRESYVQSEWDAFVEGSLRDAKDKDARPLAGGKPMAPVAVEVKAESDEGSSDEEEAKFGEPLSRTVAGDENRFKRGFGSDDETWGSRAPQDSSDEEDDADWLRPSSDDGFGVTRTVNEDLDDDDAWGTFNSATAENPFEDDSFAPATDAYASFRENPLTPSDWASAELFGPMETSWSAGDDDEVPAIVVPDDEGLIDTPTSSWSFTGEDDGEDLPPTLSPTFEDIPGFGGLVIQGQEEKSLPSDLSSSPTNPIPDRGGPSSPRHPAAGIADFGEAISPPDPALVAAASEDEPLGPGVSEDTHVMADGMLERVVDGRHIVVPMDDVAMGIETAIEKRAAG